MSFQTRTCSSAFAATADLKFESKLPLTTTLSNPTGFAALTGGFAIQKDGTYTASALVGSEVVGAAVNAELAGYKLGSARSSGMASKNFPATLIEGILRSTMIYHDDVKCSSYSMGCTQADLKVSFQLRDNITFSVGVPKTKVEVELRPLSTSSKVQTVKFVRDCSGEICHLNDLRLTNVAVFSKLSGDEKFGVHYRIQSVGSFVHLGDTTVVPPPSKTIPSSTIDTVYTVLPSRVLFPGDTFDLQVRSRFKVYLHSAEIQVVVGAGLRIQSVAVPAGVFDKDQIDPTPLGNSASKAYAVMAARKDGKKDDGKMTDELLLTLKVQVTSASSSTSTVQITQLKGITDSKTTALSPSMISAINTRAGVMETKNFATGGSADVKTAGVVHLGSDTVAGMFAYVSANQPTELINTAVLSGKESKTTINVRTVTVRGSTQAVAAKDMACKSANVQIIQSHICMRGLAQRH